VSNFLPKTALSLKVDYQTLKNLKKDLIYGEIGGYGSEGPMKNNPAFDNAMQGVVGIIHLTGNEHGKCRVGLPIVDEYTGIHMCNSILAALFNKLKTGEGAFIQTSLLETGFSLLSNIQIAYLNSKFDPGHSNISNTIPAYGVFNCNHQ
jgi:crotonobetainyl-CoA:carnitine CoA-transferase CaiB-like acyl-CoA transferase